MTLHKRILLITEGKRLPTIMADASQLERVFQNLISNAIKFRGENPPRIHIGVEKKENEWIFSVKDNGIGFDMTQADRLFRMFQRLQSGGRSIRVRAWVRAWVLRYARRSWNDTEGGYGLNLRLGRDRHFTLRYPKGKLIMKSCHENL